MPIYKGFASKPEDRALLLAALTPGSSLHSKVLRAHNSAQQRQAKVGDRAPFDVATTSIRNLITEQPELTPAYMVAIRAIERAQTPDAYIARTARGIATLNLTESDRLEARQSLKRYAARHPEQADACRALYNRIKP